jgi:hypothetical protein
LGLRVPILGLESNHHIILKAVQRVAGCLLMDSGAQYPSWGDLDEANKRENELSVNPPLQRIYPEAEERNDN